ncbi:MAG: helix-hairpin-helix domain-containing protein [candidate division WOR-3 bacterium]|jgi:hypothetical protein
MILILLLFIALPEDLVFKTEQDIDLELILRDLEYLRKKPLDINRVSVEDLAQIPFLSLTQCIRIVEYRDRYGPFATLDGLSSVVGIDQWMIDIIRPYLTVGFKRIEVKKIVTRGRARSDLPVRDDSFLYYTRIGLSLEEHSIYAVTEKDAYESAFFDHYTVGLLVSEGVRKFAIGKYNLDLGAGVVLSSVGSFFRGTDYRVMVNERGLLPYTSTVENGGFFGGAFSDSLLVKYTLYYSNQKLDGRVDSLGFARSFDESGQHVDSLSLSRKDRINEEIYGYDVRYRRPDMLISNRTFFCSYTPAFAAVDSVQSFYGESFFITSVEFRYFGESFVVFSEVARSWKNHVGGLFGFGAAFPGIDLTVSGKYFPSGFYSPKGVEAVANRAGGTIDLRHHSQVIDVGLNLDMNNKIDEDTTKYDFRLYFSKRLGILDARVNFRRRYRAEEKDISGSEVLLRIKPVSFLFFDFRFEHKSVFNEMTESGIFGALELGLDFKRFDARVRYGVFDTDSYAARIYAYEIDLPGIVNNRMLYQNGQYGFAYVAIQPVHGIKVSAKYSAVSRDGETAKKMGGQVDCSF